jgi:hypothetical protein
MKMNINLAYIHYNFCRIKLIFLLILNLQQQGHKLPSTSAQFTFIDITYFIPKSKILRSKIQNDKKGVKAFYYRLWEYFTYSLPHSTNSWISAPYVGDHIQLGWIATCANIPHSNAHYIA